MSTDYTISQPVLDSLSSALEHAFGEAAPVPGDYFEITTVEQLSSLLDASYNHGGSVGVGRPEGDAIGVDLSRIGEVH